MPYNIAMVSDFFFPQPGGVESHIYQLSTKLIDRGHKVVVITHAYKGRTGVHYLTNGLKVYHVPFLVIYRESTMPTVFSFFPVFRNIIIRESIEIVHGHASLSSFCHEAILHARTMGLRTVFTDHSLFGFADAGSILTNKLLKFTLSDVDHVVCVSHTCKENTVLRASLDPLMVSVIPNAVVAENFQPLSYMSRSSDPSYSMPRPLPQRLGPDDTITIVVISRLFYNKGTDLLIAAIPRILASHPNVRFIIAGSGPKAIDLEQMLERRVLQDRVELLGPVRHEEVRDVMVRGHIYLHPSLTEAFGTVIVEAASCGLYVVCTRVGGIPEVLPEHMTTFAKPEEDDLVLATGKAIAALRTGRVKTERFHDQVKMMYSWTDVARRTERVYDGITGAITEQEFYGNHPGGTWKAARGSAGVQSYALIDRLKRYYGCGIWAGKLFCLCAIIDYLIFLFLEFWAPRAGIDIARDWPRKPFINDKNKPVENGRLYRRSNTDRMDRRNGSLSTAPNPNALTQSALFGHRREHRSILATVRVGRTEVCRTPALEPIGSSNSTERSSSVPSLAMNTLISNLWRQVDIDHYEWSSGAYVGKGASGRVTRWNKINWDGILEDEVCVKEFDYNPRLDWPNAEEGLNKEAWIHSQVNRFGCSSIVKLRGFKHDSKIKTVRLILESMRHGELEALRLRYKATGSFFPEPFLWHVFHAFAEAACATDSKPDWQAPGWEGNPYDPDCCIVHGDIKHANILVNDPPGPLDWSNPLGSTYPAIKLIDFGLAEITGAQDESNPTNFFWRCTPGFKPPEGVHFGVEWQRPVHGEGYRRPEGQFCTYTEAAGLEEVDPNPGFLFTSTHNIWAFGKCMYDLLTLCELAEVDIAFGISLVPLADGHTQANVAYAEDTYYADGQTVIKDIMSPGWPEYSNTLQDLVMHCLAPNMDHRPTPEELLAATSAGFRRSQAGSIQRYGLDQVGRDGVRLS